MEGSDAVARLELEDVGPDFLNDAGDVVALVNYGGADVGKLPVFGVGAGDDDFDQDLVIVGRGDGGVDDGYLCACGVLTWGVQGLGR